MVSLLTIKFYALATQGWRRHRIDPVAERSLTQFDTSQTIQVRAITHIDVDAELTHVPTPD